MPSMPTCLIRPLPISGHGTSDLLSPSDPGVESRLPPRPYLMFYLQWGRGSSNFWVSRGPEATLTNALGPRYHYEIVNTSHFGRVNASHFRGTGRQPSRDTTQPCPSLSSAAYAFIYLPACVWLPDMLRDERYVAHCHLARAVLGIQDMHSSPCNNGGVFTNFMCWKSHFSIHSFTPVSIYSVIHLASL